jgi:chromosome segregation ATPase
LQDVLVEIQEKLRGLEADKEAYKEIEEVDLKKKACQKALYENKIAKNEHEIKDKRELRKQILGQREELLNQLEEKEKQIGDADTLIKDAKSELNDLQTKAEMLHSLRQDIANRNIMLQRPTSDVGSVQDTTALLASLQVGI